MSSRDASQGTPANLVSFPSLSSSLHSLPHATSMQNIALHPNMYAQRAAESEAKLQKALSKTASNSSANSSNPAYMVPQPCPSPASSSPPPLMMRKPQKSKLQT